MPKKILCKSGIYCIENIINGKKYVGKSIYVEKRIEIHKNNLRKEKHSNLHLQQAWKKYGEKNFVFYVLEICEKNNHLLSEREIFWIEKLDTKNTKHGYNETLGGDGQFGRPTSEYQKYIAKKVHTGNKYNLGKSASEKTKLKMSKSQKGRKHSEESKKKISNSRKGIIFSEEHIKNLSLSHLNHVPSNKGIPMSKGAKEKLSHSLKIRWENKQKEQKCLAIPLD